MLQDDDVSFFFGLGSTEDAFFNKEKER